MIQSIYSPDVTDGDGVLTAFAFSSRILAKSDLVVLTKVIVTGVIATLQLNSDYTIADSDVDNDAGGQIVTTVPVATGTKIYRIRRTQRTQLLNIEEAGPFAARLTMIALDRLTMMVQELDYKLRQAVKYPETSGIVDADMPTPSAGELIRWNADATGLENISLVTLAASTVIIPVTVLAGVSTIVITHSLNSATAKLIGISATWHSTFSTISQAANTITVEASNECPVGGGTVIAEVSA